MRQLTRIRPWIDAIRHRHAPPRPPHLAPATGIRAGGISVARHHHHQRVSARRRQRSRDAADRDRARSRPQAAGRGGNQGRRRRPVGAQVAASAKPDGYTLLSHNNGISGYAEVDKLFGRPPKTTRADFIPLARLIADPVLLLVNDQQPYKTLKDFVDDAKKRPGQIVYSSGGLYGATHLPVAMLEKAAGLPKLRHLPTNGGGPAITAAARQQRAGAARRRCRRRSQHIKAGKLRALALVRRAALEGAARRADAEGARLRRRLLSVGRPVRAQGHAGRRSSRRWRGAIDKAAQLRSVQDRARQDRPRAELSRTRPDFAKFWDDDAKRSDEAVQPIGKQG